MPRPQVWLVAASLLLGVALRTTAFASERSLWIDEAMLALNLLERSPERLLEPLDRNQGAPVGFLLASKLAIGCLGPSERALRLVPFLASLAGLAAFGFAAFRLLPRPSAHLALMLFAASPYIVGYAAECKQYSSDAGIAVGLLALAAPFFAGRVGLGRWLALGCAGSLAVWCSHPAIFALAGLGAGLFGEAVARKDRPRLFGLLALGGAWLLSFAGVYLISLRPMSANGYLLEYWVGHFPPRSPDAPAWLVEHYFALFGNPGGWAGRMIPASGLAGLLAIVGAAVWFREGRWPLLAVALPALAALMAAATHKYPFAGRLLLFLVPAATLLVARGAMAITDALRPGLGRMAWIVPAILIASSAHEASVQIRRPARTEEIEPVLRQVRADWRPGDRLYVYNGSGDAGAGPAFDFYSPRFDFPADRVIRGGLHRGDPSGYRTEIGKLPPGRIWVIFSHRHRDEETWIRAYFDAVGTRLDSHEAPGAAAYLYDVGP